jgi:hypothetical protein
MLLQLKFHVVQIGIGSYQYQTGQDSEGIFDERGQKNDARKVMPESIDNRTSGKKEANAYQIAQ